MRARIDIYDRDILRYLLRRGKPASVYEISKALKLSWNTTRNHLIKLQELGLVIQVKKGKISYWGILR